MRKKTLSKLLFLFALLAIFIPACEEEEEEMGPVLDLQGCISTGSTTGTAGSTIMLSWCATKGTADLATFSIDVAGSYFEGWNEAAIPFASAEQYIDSVGLILPDSEGSFTLNLTVKDANEMTDSKAVLITVEKPPIDDVFVYFANSNFIFVIQDGTTSVKTTVMEWTVTNYNESSGVATISCTLDPGSTTIPLPSTFYMRKAASGALEYSSTGSSWSNLTDPAGDINFLFGVKAASPSSLLGDVVEGIEEYTVSYPEGTSPGYKVYSEYDNSGYDSYTYSDYSKEYYCQATGFTSAVSYTYDGSDYPPWIYKRQVDLAAYSIHMPDGTLIEGGNSIPDAPGNLSGYYVYRDDVWNSSTGWYEDHSYVRLSWTDNSNNEIQFNVYIKADDGNYYQLSEIDNVTLLPDYFPANTNSGSVRIGYWVDWGSGTYYFKLKAVSAIGESEFSNEAAVTVY